MGVTIRCPQSGVSSEQDQFNSILFEESDMGVDFDP